jgi:hypothetical protein
MIYSLTSFRCRPLLLRRDVKILLERFAENRFPLFLASLYCFAATALTGALLSIAHFFLASVSQAA